MIDPHSGGVEDRISDGSNGRIRCHFAQAFGSKRTCAGGPLENGAVDFGEFTQRRHQIFIKVSRRMLLTRIIWRGTLKESMRDSHPGAANNLLSRHVGIDRASDFVSTDQLDHAYFPGLGINFDVGYCTGMSLR